MEHYVLIETTFGDHAYSSVYHNCYVFDDLEAARKKLKELFTAYLADVKEDYDDEDELSTSVTDDEAEIYDKYDEFTLIKYEVIRAKQN